MQYIDLLCGTWRQAGQLLGDMSVCNSNSVTLLVDGYIRKASSSATIVHPLSQLVGQHGRILNRFTRLHQLRLQRRQTLSDFSFKARMLIVQSHFEGTPSGGDTVLQADATTIAHAVVLHLKQKPELACLQIACARPPQLVVSLFA